MKRSFFARLSAIIILLFLVFMFVLPFLDQPEENEDDYYFGKPPYQGIIGNKEPEPTFWENVCAFFSDNAIPLMIVTIIIVCAVIAALIVRYYVKLRHKVIYDYGLNRETTMVKHRGRLSPEQPQREGYRFLGWYTDSACNNSWDSLTPVTTDVTLYAKWVKEAD